MVKIDIFDLPEDCYYTKEHTWAKIEKDGTVRVGFDDYGQKLAGKIVLVRLPETGDKVKHMSVFASMESGKWVGKLYSPISGTVKTVNANLERNPRLMNTSPYGEGWIAVIEPSDLNNELKKLLSGESAVEWLNKEIEARKKEVEKVKKRMGG